MQDNFNSAPTPPVQLTPAAQHQLPDPTTQAALSQSRAAGQPLGVINPAAPQGQIQGQVQGQVQGQPPHQAGGQPGGWAGQTVSYHGPVSMDPPTVADLQSPPAWPGAASPFAPTVHQPQLSGPKPPIYQPPGLSPVAQLPIPVPAPLPAPVPARLPVPAPAPPLAPPRASRPRVAPASQAAAPAQYARPRRSRWAAWLPLPHALLLLGVALLFIATRLPWGVDGDGQLILLQTTSVPALSSQGGTGTALQIAYDLVGAVGALSLALLLSNLFLSGLNRLLGRGCVAGCAIAPFYPILLALVAALLVAQALTAGFGGLGALAQAPGAQSYGVAGLGVAHYELGYYVWYTGLILNVAGMLGELVVWRR